MTDLRKDAQIQQAIVAFWMATTQRAQCEALAVIAEAVAKRQPPHHALESPPPSLVGWVRKNEGVLGLAALLWVTVWWVGCR